MFEKPECGWTQLDLPYVDECKYCRASYLTDIPEDTFNFFIFCLNNPTCHHHLEFDAEGWYWNLTYLKNGKISLIAPKCINDEDYLNEKDKEFIDIIIPYTLRDLAYLWLENYKKYKKEWIHFDYIPDAHIFYFIKKYNLLNKKYRKLKKLLEEGDYKIVK